MDKRAQLEDLLVDWELHREQGQELTAGEICKDFPELAPDLAKLIENFKATDWLEENDNSEIEVLPLPDGNTVSGHTGETRLDECEITLDEFNQRLMDSRIMDRGQVQEFNEATGARDATALAQRLVDTGKLTSFQAQVLLQGQDIPLVLDRYVLLDQIGQGGMGVVYKALHQQMDRVVALKILPKEAVDSEDKVKRFEREVHAAAKLHHPNIVTAFDATESDGTHFLVMELVHGDDLAQTIQQQGVLSPAQAVDHIAQAARGLEHAHSRGIIHRDIKPGNLLLDDKGHVKILDMGLARIANIGTLQEENAPQELTGVGVVMGTVAYLPPEQAIDTRHADERSDVYSLGCTLFYLLAGQPPYAGGTIVKTMLAHREGKIPSICELRDDVPEELDAVFKKMVAKQPEDRFQSMNEVITALEELDIQNETGRQPAVASPQAFQETATLINTSRDVMPSLTPDSGHPPKRRRGVITASLLGFVVLLMGLILRLQTPAGTLVLEIDQPEIVGARVLIDGDKNITIKTGKGQERIRVRPDQERHLLEVKMAGFRTFSEEFTYDTGNQKKITVKLERENVASEREQSKSGISPKVFAHERQVAEWAFDRGGGIYLKNFPTQFANRRVTSFFSSKNLRLTDAVALNALTKTVPANDFVVLGLYLRRIQPGNDGFELLAKLTSLHYLDLENSSITDQDMETIGKISTLKVIGLSHNAITDIGFSKLANLRELQSVSIANTEVTDKGLSVLIDLPDFHEINLNGSMLSPEAVDVLKKISSLKELFVYGLNNDNLQQISRLKQLKQITILEGGNTYSTTGCQKLIESLPKCDIFIWDLRDNSFRGLKMLLESGSYPRAVRTLKTRPEEPRSREGNETPR